MNDEASESGGGGGEDVLNTMCSLAAEAFPRITLPVPAPMPLPERPSLLHGSHLSNSTSNSNSSDAANTSAASTSLVVHEQLRGQSAAGNVLVLGRLTEVTGIGPAAVRVSRKHIQVKVVVEPAREEADSGAGAGAAGAGVVNVTLQVTQLSSNCSRYRRRQLQEVAGQDGYACTDSKAMKMMMVQGGGKGAVGAWGEWTMLKKGTSVLLKQGDEIQFHPTVPLKHRLVVHVERIEGPGVVGGNAMVSATPISGPRARARSSRTPSLTPSVPSATKGGVSRSSSGSGEVDENRDSSNDNSLNMTQQRSLDSAPATLKKRGRPQAQRGTRTPGRDRQRKGKDGRQAPAQEANTPNTHDLCA
jgi:hypothetical protein